MTSAIPPFGPQHVSERRSLGNLNGNDPAANEVNAQKRICPERQHLPAPPPSPDEVKTNERVEARTRRVSTATRLDNSEIENCIGERTVTVRCKLSLQLLSKLGIHIIEIRPRTSSAPPGHTAPSRREQMAHGHARCTINV